jgi:hypothetical protein
MFLTQLNYFIFLTKKKKYPQVKKHVVALHVKQIFFFVFIYRKKNLRQIRKKKIN